MVGSNPARGLGDFFWGCQVLYTGYLIGLKAQVLIAPGGQRAVGALD